MKKIIMKIPFNPPLKNPKEYKTHSVYVDCGQRMGRRKMTHIASHITCKKCLKMWEAGKTA